MKKYLALSLSMLLVFVLCAPLCAMAKSETDDANAFVSAYPESTMERYVCAKAVQNNTTFEEEMKKELSEVVPLSIDEMIAYRTQSGRAGRIETNLCVLYPVITTEAKVVVNQVTGQVVRVLDFGFPYASVENQDATWNGGGFNVDRLSATSCRISAIGQFFINNGSRLTVGEDILSYPMDLGAKTVVLNIVTRLYW